MGVILPIVAGVLVAALFTAAIIRSRRRTRDLPELNKHPERLEQMLDPTDDA